MGIQVVSFHCVLKNSLGRVISRTYSQNVVAHAQSGTDTLAALAEALKDLKKGETRQVCLRAEQAYGFYDPKLVVVRPLDQLDLSSPVAIGDEITYVVEGKKKQMRVTELSEESVTLDGNHPLAGQDLVFEIQATDARPATAEDLLDPDEVQTGSLLH